MDHIYATASKNSNLKNKKEWENFVHQFTLSIKSKTLLFLYQNSLLFNKRSSMKIMKKWFLLLLQKLLRFNNRLVVVTCCLLLEVVVA